MFKTGSVCQTRSPYLMSPERQQALMNVRREGKGLEIRPGKGKKEGSQAQTAQTEAKAWP